MLVGLSRNCCHLLNKSGMASGLFPIPWCCKEASGAGGAMEVRLGRAQTTEWKLLLKLLAVEPSISRTGL